MFKNFINNDCYTENIIDISFLEFDNLPILTVKNKNNFKYYYLFNKFKVWQKKLFNQPVIKDNTFLVWEPCSHSHAEVVPGYVKYLLDLGYHVSVLITPERYDEGLFSKFGYHPNISYNYLTQKQIRKFFKKNNLSNVKGVLVTTAEKLCDQINYEKCYKYFNKKVDKEKIYFVSHEAKYAIDSEKWNEKLITLRKLNYKNKKSIVVNPHYFGNIVITPKNKKITNFVTIGALKAKRKDSNMIVDVAVTLYERGCREFKITVIGSGELKHIPEHLRSYFDIKGRLNFEDMFKEIEKADFILTAYDENNKAHQRYNTTGTSGNFQLIYSFLKPCIINEHFAEINGFNDKNAILHKSKKDYIKALKKCIEMSDKEYQAIQDNLKTLADKIYKDSKENLRRLIND